jgi:hypothetical protein
LARFRSRARGAWWAALLLVLNGCITVVVPPRVQQGGGPVFLLDHGRHSSLVLPTQGALGRKGLPGPPTEAAVLEQVKVPIEHLFPVVVETTRIESLRLRLDRIFDSNASTRLYNPLYDLYFVHDPQAYSILHDSNQEVATWLEALGCRIRGGPALLSDWRVEAPDSTPPSSR